MASAITGLKCAYSNCGALFLSFRSWREHNQEDHDGKSSVNCCTCILDADDNLTELNSKFLGSLASRIVWRSMEESKVKGYGEPFVRLNKFDWPNWLEKNWHYQATVY